MFAFIYLSSLQSSKTQHTINHARRGTLDPRLPYSCLVTLYEGLCVICVVSVYVNCVYVVSACSHGQCSDVCVVSVYVLGGVRVVYLSTSSVVVYADS